MLGFYFNLPDWTCMTCCFLLPQQNRSSTKSGSLKWPFRVRTRQSANVLLLAECHLKFPNRRLLPSQLSSVISPQSRRRHLHHYLYTQFLPTKNSRSVVTMTAMYVFIHSLPFFCLSSSVSLTFRELSLDTPTTITAATTNVIINLQREFR